MATLGSNKGQLWLRRNHHRLRIPMRTSLGATINFQAGTVKRAPYTIQKLGLEWLWRIKEEPYLWRRYLHDGSMLLNLLLTCVLPLAIELRSQRRRCQRSGNDLVLEQTHGTDCITLSCSGSATACNVDEAIACFGNAVATKKQIVIDFSGTCAIDARFLGLLLMLRKQLEGPERGPTIYRHLSPTGRECFASMDSVICLRKQLKDRNMVLRVMGIFHRPERIRRLEWARTPLP